MARMGDNFTVDNSKPNVSYASPESFIPVYVSSEWAVQADIPEGLWMYRDEQAYASEFSPRIIQERQRKEEERRKAEEERKAKEEESKKKADKGKRGSLISLYASEHFIFSSGSSGRFS